MNSVSSFMGSIERRLRRLIGDERGVSAVEFALLCR
jgi:Flp pilus assembly protein TadG